MPMPECEFVGAAALLLRPGDTLIVAFPGHVETAEADRIRAKLRERIPGLADVVLITQTAALAAYRPEAEEGRTDA